MAHQERSRWKVLEVHNFGGFFGGDTVTLTAARVDDSVQETLTIDEKALANVCDRYHIAPTMVLDLDMIGDRVERAELRAAAEWSLLDTALAATPSAPPLHAPVIRAYHCTHCNAWVVGSPMVDELHPYCQLCGKTL